LDRGPRESSPHTLPLSPQVWLSRVLTSMLLRRASSPA
jgi:hypothetical protein